MRAHIELILSGDEVDQKAADEFVNLIQTATMMIPKTGNTKLEVGTITLKGDDE